MNAYYLRFIVDIRIFPPSKFDGLPQSAHKTRVLSNGFVNRYSHKFSYTIWFCNNLWWWIDLRIQLVVIASMENKSLKYVSQHQSYL